MCPNCNSRLKYTDMFGYDIGTGEQYRAEKWYCSECMQWFDTEDLNAKSSN